MVYRIEVSEKEGFADPVGLGVKKDIEDLGLKGRIKDVKTVQVYLLEGELTDLDIDRICANLLIDPVTQRFSYNRNIPGEEKFKVVEVAHNPGVMDPVEESAKKAIADMGINGVRTVRT
ncbi:MAG: phosphoribosylformylglycinamidine synthase subunit PurS, partial [Candidatus Omnitrophica bacterium]|nr:phosphoribosylformylglycinamidine synthase subunit PurS [Candidatus Omnitrophota bacterium]